MVDLPEEYKWSSYQANGLGKKIALHTPHQIYARLGKSDKDRLHAYRALFQAHIDTQQINEIRTASNKGMALGSDRFKEEVELLTGRRVTSLKPGPKNSELLL